MKSERVTWLWAGLLLVGAFGQIAYGQSDRESDDDDDRGRRRWSGDRGDYGRGFGGGFSPSGGFAPGGGFGGPGRPGGWSGGDWSRGRDSGRGGGDRDDNDDEGRRGGRRSFDWSSFDANRNGLLDANEITPQLRPFLLRAVQRAGLDVNKPISLEALNRGRDGGSGQTPGQAGGSATSAAPTTSLVPGFGTGSASAPTVAGFGTAPAALTTPAPNRSSSSSSSSSTSTSASSGGSGRTETNSSASQPSAEDLAKVRKYAEGYMKQNDKNGSGVLEKDEWTKTTEGGDADGNGSITADELANHLASFGRRGSSGRSSSSGSKPSSSYGSSSSTSSSSRPRRFLTATERLPKDLPSWFTRSDRDADGQVMMHEFASSWSVVKAAEFNRYDLNGDGVITPREGQEAEKR